MARPEFYQGTRPDSPFYGSPVDGVVTERSAAPRLQPEELPAGWLVQLWSSWEGWTPRDWRPRLQGWKIHVSATPGCAVQTLAATTRICVAHEVAFKFLPTRTDLVDSSNKQGDRGGAGKFITIYPDDDAQFAVLLTELAAALDGQQGPYILSDLRFGDVPVFARYGGIMAMDVADPDDRPIPSIAAGDTLTLVPDRRTPRFSVPDGIELPEVLRASYERSQQRSDSRLSSFASIRPLHFSNAGGVYKATLPDGTVRVLREARPHAGLDSRDRCALQRQQTEERVLTDLVGVPGVQQLRGSFTAWEHRYLELDYVEGGTLTAWVVRTITEQQDDPQRYAQRAVRLGGQLIEIVERIHAHGWAVGDLHTGNILVDDQDRVTLLDLEDATRLDEPRAIGFRVFEFCGSDELTAAEADWFAVARSIMMLYVADWEIEAVAPGYWAASKRKVRSEYGAAAADQLDTVEGRYPDSARPALSTSFTVDVTTTAPDEDDAVDRLLTGIGWSRRFSPRHAYPGDVTQPGRSVPELLSSGRAGICWARQRIGGDPLEADLDALVAIADGWDPSQSPGLLTGLAGIALALGDTGRPEAAVRAATTALDHSCGRRRLDLVGGQAGTVLAAFEVAMATDDRRLLDRALTTYERLHATLEPAGAGGSARASLTRKGGLYWGLTGLALTDVVAHLATGDPEFLSRAAGRIRSEVERCVRLESGELMVRDTENGRVLPYLEWGSAGIWLLATAVERLLGQELLAEQERSGLARACSSDFYIYPGLDHGRAGILAALTAGGPPYAAEAARQSALVRESLLTHGGMFFSIGDGLFRLSSDLGTGAAGVALALHAHRRDEPYLTLPIGRRSAAILDSTAGPATVGAGLLVEAA